MARVRVLAERSSGDLGAVPRPHFSAQIFEDRNDREPVWTCTHDHGSAIDAQLCGVQFLTDRLTGRRRPAKGAA
jgi:hypothetical protein